MHLGFPYNLSKCAFIILEDLGDYLWNYCFAMSGNARVLRTLLSELCMYLSSDKSDVNDHSSASSLPAGM